MAMFLAGRTPMQYAVVRWAKVWTCARLDTNCTETEINDHARKAKEGSTEKSVVALKHIHVEIDVEWRQSLRCPSLRILITSTTTQNGKLYALGVLDTPDADNGIIGMLSHLRACVFVRRESWIESRPQHRGRRLEGGMC